MTRQVPDKQMPDNHWLTRPSTVRQLWIVSIVVLILLLAAQYLIPIDGTFAFSNGFGFAAWFGFGSCVAMVLAARVLGWLLKRPEDYYKDSGATDQAAGNLEVHDD